MKEKQVLPDQIFGLDTSIFLLWLQPFALLILLIISVGLIILPKFGEISAKITKINEVNKKITETNQKRKYLETVNQEEMQNNATSLAAGLLPEKSAYLLVKIVQSVAAGVGYAIDDFSVSLGDIKVDSDKVNANANYDKIPVQVTLIGDPTRYLDLVRAIERSLPLMSIDDFKMSSNNIGATIKLSISAYYLKDISNLKLENLSLADLTPSQNELDLLTTIKDYSLANVGTGDSNAVFVKYNRNDPFLTP
ncbi:MAG: hypothetical protein WC784_00900 [Candidatus Shapirobacteria bacterium]|jgi:hypothetical protein